MKYLLISILVVLALLVVPQIFTLVATNTLSIWVCVASAVCIAPCAHTALKPSTKIELPAQPVFKHWSNK